MQSSSIRNLSQHLFWIALSAFIAWMPFYNNGVFFSRGHAHIDLVLLILLSFYLVFRIISWFVDKPSTGEKPLYVHLSWFDVAFAVYVILYLLSLFYAASLPLAVEGALDALALIFPFALMRNYGHFSLASTYLLCALGISSIGINAIGFANGWGQLLFPSAITLSPSLQVSSVFQYHNTYASFVTAIGLGLMAYCALSPRWIMLRAFFTGMAALDFAGLLLSDSRGALLFFVIVLICLLIGLKTQEGSQVARSRFLLFFAAAWVGAGLSYTLLRSAILHQDVGNGWIAFVIGIVLPIFLVLAFSVPFRDYTSVLLSAKKTLPIITTVYIVGILGIAAMKSKSFLHKIHSYHVHQLSVIQRFIFWRDGLRIFAYNPISGKGYGAWAAMFERVESYPYYSTQVHSFFMDTLMNIGILGICALLFVLWPLLRTVIAPWRTILETDVSIAGRRALSVMALMLFAHSLMDWDFAFLSMEFLFFLGVGSAFSLRSHLSGQGFSVPLHGWLMRTATTITCLLCLAGLYQSAQTVHAENLVRNANATLSGEGRINLYAEAVHIVPYNTTYLTDEANAFLANGSSQQNLQQAISILQKTLQFDPYNATVQSQLATIAFEDRQYSLAYEAAARAFRNAPFFPSNVSLAINAATIDGMQKAPSNPSVARQRLVAALSLYQQYQKNLSIVQHLPPYLPPMQPYVLDSFTFDSLATAELGIGNNQMAIQFAAKELANSDKHTRDVAKMITLIAQQGGLPALQNPTVLAFVKERQNLHSSYALLTNLRFLMP
ncbi:O-antigen ligase family protein [Alicyclobacillus sp. TC]|uniref:O-antigen ligase family protein n=1 Tax=Alicyclobacillus sp. TC TaxID=2606450 RepID=UPI0019342AB0|nr:O-antigen ligase family protein [Alicyclobacillus sp. TC]